MIIQHNMPAMNTNRQLGISAKAGQKSTEKLSSGYRINRAGDDAAGLAISEKMRSQIRGLDRASANSQDGISLIQTAEGALNETQSILQRMRELAVQAANGTNTDSDRNEIQKEVNQLTSEINRIGNTTEFNTMKLLKGNTNKAEIGNVDTDTLKEAQVKDKVGDIGNFNIDQNSVIGKESKTELIANTADATGSVKSSTLDKIATGKAGTQSSIEIAGLTFSSKDKSAAMNGKELHIISLNDYDTDGTTEMEEGIFKDTDDNIYIALKQSSIDSTTDAAELITRIQKLATATIVAGTNGSAIDDISAITGVATGNLTASTLDDLNLEITTPKGEPTADEVKDKLPKSAGKEVTGNFGNGAEEVLGSYKLSIKDAFKEDGDKITIAGQEFTTKTGTAADPVDNAAGEFDRGNSSAVVSFRLTGTVGASVTAADKIQITKADGSGDVDIALADGDSVDTIVGKMKTGLGADYSVDYDNKTGYITVKSNDTGATDAGTALVVKVVGTATNLGGLKLYDVSGADKTAVAAGITGVAGADTTGAAATAATKIQAQTSNLANAINANANLKDKYIATVDSTTGDLIISEKAGHGGESKDIDRKITVEGSGGEDNSIVITNPTGINLLAFELIADGATPNLTIAQDAADPSKFTITLGADPNQNTAEKIQEALRNLVGLNDLADGTKLDFSNITVEAKGKWDEETTNTSNLKDNYNASHGGIEEKLGTYSFDITKSFAEGDEVIIAGKTFIAKNGNADKSKGEFDISNSDKTVQAASLRAAIEKNVDLNAKYTVTASKSKITLTEREATGTDIVETDIKSQATGIKGEFKVGLSEILKDGASIEIDGQKIDVSSKNQHVGYNKGTAIKEADSLENQVAALVDAINKNADMSYTAKTDEEGNLILTQKEAKENAPVITTTSSTKGTFDVTFQVGANTGQSMTIAIGDTRSVALGVASDGSEKSIIPDNGVEAFYTENQVVTDGTTNDNVEHALDITSYEKATAAIGVIDDALAAISAQRSQLGAYQNRLEHTIANLDNTSENLQASESRIRDVDMAKEMSEFSKNNILQQAAQSMLAQANQSTQGVLTLLR